MSAYATWGAASRGERPDRDNDVADRREEPVTRPSDAVAQMCRTGRSEMITPNPVLVIGRSAGSAASSLSPTFEAAFGGARLDPSRPPLAAGSVLSHEDRHRGSKAQPFGPSDLGDRSGSKARPFTKYPELRDGAPRFLGRETLEKPDSATSIAGPRTRMECLKRPTAKSVHFGSTNIPQKFTQSPESSRPKPPLGCRAVLELGGVRSCSRRQTDV